MSQTDLTIDSIYLADALLSKEITREELAAAYLTLFFKGKLTQSSLSTAIELSNITPPIKLRTNFDGLLNIIKKKKTSIEYNILGFVDIA
jgi:hypothetical protein